MKLITLSAAMLVALAFPAFAQEVGNDDATFDGGIMVTSDDVRTCPYRIVQPVSVNVTEDYNADTRGKIFAKLRREAKKAGADAVVLVTKGDKHMTAWAWSRREYTGRAIRYVDRSCAPQGQK